MALLRRGLTPLGVVHPTCRLRPRRRTARWRAGRGTALTRSSPSCGRSRCGPGRARRSRTRSGRSGSPRRAPGRAAQRRDLRLTAGLSRAADRPGPDRKLAPPLQHRPAALRPRSSSARTRGHRARPRRVAGRATPTSSAGHAPAGSPADAELTFHPDHSVGAGHPVRRSTQQIPCG